MFVTSFFSNALYRSSIIKIITCTQLKANIIKKKNQIKLLIEVKLSIKIVINSLKTSWNLT